MIRNFVAGTLWGVVVAGVGLAVVSQVAPMPEGQAVLDADAVAVAQEDVSQEGVAKPEDAQKKPALVQPDIAAPAPDPAPAQALPVPAPVQPLLPAQPAILPAKPAASDALAPDPKLSADAPSPAPSDPIAPALAIADSSDDQLALNDAGIAPAAKATVPNVADASPALDTPKPAAVDAAPAIPADTSPALAPPADVPLADKTDAVPKAADLPPPAPAPEALLDPAPQVNVNPAPATIAPDDPAILPDAPPPVAPAAENPDTDVALADIGPKADGAAMQPVAPLEPAPSLIAKDQPSTFAPDGTFTSAADGVTIGRLPRIGAPPANATDPQAVADQSPLRQFARNFDNPSGKPLFAVILRDTGAADIDRASLAALPFPVSFVVDPLAPNAAEAAAIYRAAGQEVIMLASGIPVGAQASDLEQTFQSLGAVLPQAVAVMDLGDGGFQNDRPLASLVVPIVKSQGRGLITFNRGLNAADQVARRIDVPSATIFRQLDAAGEDLPLIRRYLDRAAFKAAQEGRVMVLGDTRPETIAALMEWTVEGRASSVTLAPVTAVLLVD